GTLNPGTYPGGIALSDDAHFNAGVYILKGGGLKIVSGLTVTGTDVTFYNTDSNGDGTGTYSDITINKASVTLSAPTSGSNAGMLFFQARNNTNEIKVSGNAPVILTGIIY